MAKYDAKELNEKLEKLNKSLEPIVENIDALNNQTNVISDNGEFSGEFAKSIQSYYSEVHLKALEAIANTIIHINVMSKKIVNDAKEIDSSADAKINNEYLISDQIKQLKETSERYGDSRRVIEEQLRRVNDIVNLDLRTDYFYEAAQSADNYLSDIITSIDHFEDNDYTQELQEMLIEFEAMLSYMDSVQAPSGGVNYKSGDITKQPFYQRMTTIMDKMKGVWIEEFQKLSFDPVNLATGNLVYKRTDLRSIKDQNLTFERFYNSIDTYNGLFGNNWISNYEMKIIKQNNDELEVIFSDGHVEQFKKDPKALRKIYVSETGKVVKAGFGTLDLAEGDIIYSFDPKIGNLSEIRTNGELTRLIYEDKKLVKIASQNGFLKIEYNQDNQISKVSNEINQVIEYKYENQKLVEIKENKEKIYEYSYNQNNGLTKIINEEGIVVLENEYDTSNRAIKQIFGDQSVVSYSYDDQQKVTQMTERDGSKTKYYADDKYRHTKIEYADQTVETFKYNQANKVIYKKDPKGNETTYSYDQYNNLIEEINALGYKKNYEYDYQNNLTKVKLENGAIYQFEYSSSSSSKISKIISPNNNQISLEYDDQDNLTQIVGADGGVVKFEYQNKNLIKVESPFQNAQTKYEYNENNQVVKVINADGGVIKYEYDLNGRMIKQTDPLGNSKQFSYNRKGHITQIINPNGLIVKFKYNSLNKISEIIEGNKVTSFKYNSMWNISKVTFSDGSSKEYKYNSKNRLTSYINELGGNYHYNYDSNGNIKQIYEAVRKVGEFEYDQLNRVVSEEVEGNVRSYSYDEVGNIIKVTVNNQTNQSFEYDLENNLTKQIDVNGAVTKYTYTANNQIETITNPYGAIIKHQYYIGGILKSIEDEAGLVVEYEYDSMGRIICQKDKLNNQTRYKYDLNGNIIQEITPSNEIHQFKYDEMQNLVEHISPLNLTTKYEYDQYSNLVKVTDPIGNIVEYDYDSMNRLKTISSKNEEQQQKLYEYSYNQLGQMTKIKNSDQSEETRSYDQFGKVIKQTNRANEVQEFEYNQNNQLLKLTTKSSVLEYKYNKQNQVEEIIANNQTRAKARYDAKGNVEQFNDFSNNQTKYEYGLLNELKAIKYPDNRQVNYEYDKYLRLTKVKEGSKEFNYNYDEVNRLIQKGTDNLITKYSYDANSRITKIVEINNNQIIEQIENVYDANSNIIKQEKVRANNHSDSGIYSYEYDKLERLTQVNKGSKLVAKYGYDLNGNRISKQTNNQITNYTYNNNNQLIKEITGNITKEYKYNLNGYLSEIISNNQETSKYSYNSIGKLIKYKSSNKEINYEYDPLGKLVSKNNGINHIKYTNDYIKTINEISQVEIDGVITNYTYDGLGAISQNLNPITKDHLGSVLGIVKENYYQSNSYDEYGNTNDLKDSELGYTGYLYDQDVEMYNARARMYDSKNGRFNGLDIVTSFSLSSNGYNRYNYVGNSPLKYVDLDGNSPAKPLIEKIGDSIKNVFNAIIGLSENIESNISGTFAYSEIGAGSETHTHKPIISLDLGSKEGMSINIPEWMPFIGGSNIGMHINTQSYTAAISTKIQASIPGIEGAILLGTESLVGGKEIIKLSLEIGLRNRNKKDTIAGLYLGLPNSGIYTKDIYNSEFGSSYNWYSSGKINTASVIVLLAVVGVIIANPVSIKVTISKLLALSIQRAAPAIVTLIIALLTQNSILKTRSLEKNKECSNL